MIVIPSKVEKQQSVLVDAFRIIAWTSYKSQQKCKGLEGYAEFDIEWKQHEIHGMSDKELKKFIHELGYSENELLEERSKYYQRTKNSSNNSDISNIPEIQFQSAAAPDFVDEFEYPEPPY